MNVPMNAAQPPQRADNRTLAERAAAVVARAELLGKRLAAANQSFAKKGAVLASRLRRDIARAHLHAKKADATLAAYERKTVDALDAAALRFLSESQ